MAWTAGSIRERYGASRRCLPVLNSTLTGGNIMSSIPEFFRSRPDAPSHSSSENVEVISRNVLASGLNCGPALSCQCSESQFQAYANVCAK